MRCPNIRSRLAGNVLTALVPVWFFGFFFPMATSAADARVPADAWWNALAVSSPAPISVPPPSSVPAEAIAVGHEVQPDKMAAIGITLQSPRGSIVDKLTLTLKEAGGPAANIGAAGAKVVACPITGPWEPVHNGAWSAVPDHDCGLAKVEGKRSDDGTWTFDLRSFGAQWLDAEFPLDQSGILFLIEQSTSPVQISFFGVKTGRYRLEFSARAPSEPQPTKPVVVGALPSPGAAPPLLGAPAPEAPATDESPAVLITRPAQSRGEPIRKPNLTGNLPWGAWLLVPIAIGAAAAVSYALGPGRDQQTSRRRFGPVSRALSRGERDG
jgi:hypothetical protein